MILITGATGLVGSHLTLELAKQNTKVRALYRNSENIAKTKNVFDYFNFSHLFDNIEWVKGDLTDIPSLNQAFEGVSQVYHCAALISFDPRDEDKLRKINIEGTANIVNCCIAFGVRKICYTSSIAALGDTIALQTTITEETEWNPEKNHGDYALSKYGAEMEVWRGWQEGLEVVIINPGIIFGYGFPNDGSGVFFTSTKKGNSFYTKGIVGIVTVEDVVSCSISLMNSSVSGQRYCLVAENESIENILIIISDALKCKRPSYKASKSLTNIAWKLDWLISKMTGKKRKMTKATAIASHSKTLYDSSKIKQQLQFDFTPMKPYLEKLSKQYQ